MAAARHHKKVKRGKAITPGVSGGIVLPADNLATVSARDDVRAGSIRAASIQGMAFTTLTDPAGLQHPAITALLGRRGSRKTLLMSALTIDPATRKPYTRVAAAHETLRVDVGPGSHIGLFAGAGGSGTGGFDPRGLLLGDQINGGSPVTVLTDFAQDGAAAQDSVRQLTLNGNGGSIDTYTQVRNITSSGPLGDVLLRAGKTETLQSITAPGMIGTLNVFGGTIIGAVPPTVGK